MSAPFSFADARPLARHCAELLQRPGRDRDAARLPELAARMEAELKRRLRQLLGEPRIKVVGTVQQLAEVPAQPKLDALTASAMLDMPGIAEGLAVCISGGDLLALTEQVFGGQLADGAPLPDELPLTAVLVAAEVFSHTATALGGALECADTPRVSAPRTGPTGLSSPAEQPGSRTVTWAITQPERSALALHLILPGEAQRGLFRPMAISDGGGARSAAAAAAATIPFDLRAELAAMTLPLSTVARLKSGDVVPLLMPRGVQLKVAEVPVAEGTVGAVDGQTAVQLTRILAQN